MEGERRRYAMSEKKGAEKTYYRIGEIAKLLRISRHSLINLERMGIIKPERTLTNQRIYPEEVICKICDYYKKENEEREGEQEWMC